MEAEQLIAVDRDVDGLVEMEIKAVKDAIAREMPRLSEAAIDSMSRMIIFKIKAVPKQKRGNDRLS
jgi:hypothetical protein